MHTFYVSRELGSSIIGKRIHNPFLPVCGTPPACIWHTNIPTSSLLPKKPNNFGYILIQLNKNILVIFEPQSGSCIRWYLSAAQPLFARSGHPLTLKFIANDPSNMGCVSIEYDKKACKFYVRLQPFFFWFGGSTFVQPRCAPSKGPWCHGKTKEGKDLPSLDADFHGCCGTGCAACTGKCISWLRFPGVWSAERPKRC